MRKPLVPLVVLLATVVAVAVFATAAFAAPPPQPRNFVTPLSGHEEVPPVATSARGVAIFQLSADGTELSFRLIASNIENITQAHIHCCAPAGANAGVVAWLYPSGPPAQLIPGRHNGVLATGTITADDLVGGLAGATLDDLIEQIIDGQAYVNVHTQQNPPGEIRGQLD